MPVGLLGKKLGQTRVYDAKGVITWGPGPTEEHHYLDFSWYAIHPLEVQIGRAHV
jgi:hypothetical protein